MKNFYLWIVAAMVSFGILPGAAQDAEVSNIKFTVNVPNTEAINCTMNGEPYELKQGANLFDVPAYTNFYFSANNPWRISSVLNKNGTTASGFYGDSWYLSANPSIADDVFTISVININDYRTSQFTLNVDDPSLVNVMMGGYYTTLQLTAGENIVKFDPAMETYLTITPTNYSVPLYQCKLNGTEVARQGTGFTVMLEEDCVVDVIAAMPDEDRTVSFSYSDGAEGSIGVQINGAPLSDFAGQSLTVKLGTQMTLTGNTSDYSYSQVLVNGEQVPFYGSYTFYVMDNTEVYVDARPYGNIKATVIVNLPEMLTLYRGYGTDFPIELKEGENNIELPENSSSVRWDVNNNAILNSVTVNGEALSAWNTSWTLRDGDTMVFDLTEKVFDKQAIVWIDNLAAPACSFYLSMYSPNDHTAQFSFENGYNYVTFYEAMNPFSLGWYGQSDEIPNVHLTGRVYLNGEQLSPMYESSASYSFTLANDDVVKLFMEAAPVECKVAFDIAEAVNATVKKDIVTTVEDPAAGFDCFNGTQVNVSGKDIKVAVNGTEIAGVATESDNSESIFTFIVNDPTTNVTISADGLSGVSVTEAEGDTDVYNTLGVKVGKKSGLNGMAPGIYIMNGKKVAIGR